MAIVEVKNLKKKFGDFIAVDGISFNVNEGEIVGLLGPNGAGKTTTIQMLLDLITPTSGSIKVFGKDMCKNRTETLEQMNFSSPYVSLPNNLKVWENLTVFAGLYGEKIFKKRLMNCLSFST